MNYIDTWLFVESVLDEVDGIRIRTLLQQLAKEGIVTSCITLLETKFRLCKEIGQEKTERAIQAIMGMEKLIIVPVVSTVALAAADLRKKYYTKECQMSLADALHLTTAKETGCTKFYSGDPEFKDVKELQTIIL